MIAMSMLPYIIGYACFYDAYPWLSFLPYKASLAFGPLRYFYVRSLMAADLELPTGWWRHFLPVMPQLGHYCVLFTMPFAFKNEWNSTIHVPLIYPLELSANFISVARYWAISFRHYRGNQQWLVNNVSDREDHHLE